MAEASVVVGLISSVISIIDATKRLYDAAKDAKGQPEAFRQVAARLPLVETILQEAGSRAQTLNVNKEEALKPIVESCNQKARNLKKIFKKVLKKDDDKWFDRYKKIVSTLVKGQRVESLMGDILKDVQMIACEAGTATDAQVKEIDHAIEQINELPSSLQDETGPVVTQNHRGSGHNIANTGRGAQHNGTGDLYHNEIRGDAHFGDNPSNSTFNVTTYQLPKEQNHRYLEDLYTTDPRDDKMRIEETKGGLLKDLGCWILRHADFKRWRDDEQSRLLWIKGDPGKGKTMLLCTIINEMSPKSKLEDNKANVLLSYFFCQATDARINNAAAVVRGLIYLLIYQQPSLVSHVQEKYKGGAKNPFALEDPNSWQALSTVFRNILKDPSLKSIYLIIDALDECLNNLPKLLNLIVEESSASSRVKWIVSSRNEASVETDLETATQKVRLCLELNEESVSEAVTIY
ncbi:Vegetative incompatibility protein [Drechslerella dactyloides]|uniref:Vegetative incompatibility protein n=1 Tax=Drechslerella dactyloides TaxID=74499 RepID=A0AAD6NLP3_DREDA|nr:Vegetative incompatibility protein [Drechslerella dactyloides]